MIYIQGLTDIAVFELENNGKVCTLKYSELGSWTPHFKGKEMMSVTDCDGDLNHIITSQNCVVTYDAGELVELYYLLDYMYNYSGMIDGINTLHTMKLKELDEE